MGMFKRFEKMANIPKRHAETTPDRGERWGAEFERVDGMLGTGALVGFLGGRGTGKTRMAVACIRRTCARVATKMAAVEAEIPDNTKPGWFDRDRQRQEAMGDLYRYRHAGYGDNAVPAEYITAMGLFLELRSTYDGTGNESQVIKRLLGCRLLVIDEIQERGNSDWENRILGHIIDQRYAAMLDTIIVGNLTPDNLSATLGPSFADRLMECGLIVEFNWDSYRIPKEQEAA